LLDNGSLNTFPRQPNHEIAAREADVIVEDLLEKKYATIEELLEAVFSMPSATKLYTEDRSSSGDPLPMD
jgi:hypothetical protein